MPAPLLEGALIFDEVKVTANINWNAKSNKCIGYALTHDDMASLHDIYQELSKDDKTKKASYILQFLWRDVVTNVDIIGPYYTSQEGLDHKFIMSCVMETMHLFYMYDFHVVLLTCDGASANLKLLKLLCSGDCGVYPILENEGIRRFEVPNNFRNIYTGGDVHVLICPSHQLKNLMAALYSSRQTGKKNFQFGDNHFRCDSIFGVYNREKTRAERGEARRVPDLLSSYVYRDKWTRLNVKASKIMQQDHVISEIKNKLKFCNLSTFMPGVGSTVSSF